MYTNSIVILYNINGQTGATTKKNIRHFDKKL